MSKASDIEPARSGLDELLFGAAAEDTRIIRHPFGCAVHGSGLYFTDTRFGVIMRADLSERKLEILPLEGRTAPQKPINLCFAPDGTMYYADAYRRQVVVLDPELNLVAEFGPFGENGTPVDVEVSGDDLYVVDGTEAVVRILDRHTGEERRVLGNVRTRDELLRGPSSVAVDESGYCYVVDTIYCRVYVWDKDGNFVRHIGKPGNEVGELARPKGAAILDRTLWVLDSAFENCQVFSFDSEPLMFFGGSGSEPGRFTMPADIWIGREGLEYLSEFIAPDFSAERLVVVTNQFGPHKVSLFAFGRSSRFEYPDDSAVLPAVPVTPPPAPDADAPDVQPDSPIRR